MYGRLGCFSCLFFYWLGVVGLAHAGVTYDAYAVYDGAIANGQFQAKYVIRETADTGLKTYKRTEALYPATRTKDLVLGGIKEARNAGIGVAVLGAVAAAGWAIDELTGQITSSGSGESGSEGADYTSGYYYHGLGKEPSATKSGYLGQFNPDYTWRLNENNQVQYINSNGDWTFVGQAYHSQCSDVDLAFSYCQAPQLPVSASDFVDLLSDILSSKDIKNLLEDKYGNPLLTPELVEAMKSLANPDTDTVKEDQPDGQEEPDFCQQKANQGNPFCDDSGEQPEIEEMPTTTIEMVEWDSGLGAGSCPPPRTSSFQGKDISYDYDSACDAITTFLKPITIAGALLASAFILVGVRV